MNKQRQILTKRSEMLSVLTRKTCYHIALGAMVASALFACDDWGEKDPPAGGQIYPTLATISTMPFNEELDTEVFKLSGTPEVQTDDTLGSVLALNGGIMSVTNALEHAESGVGITMWVKEVEVSANSLLFAFADDSNLSGNYVGVNAKGQLIVDGTVVDAAQNALTDTMLINNKWRYVAFDISNSGYKIYSDGQLIYENEQDLTEVVAKMVAAQNFYIGAGNTTEYLVDNVKIYRNTITSKEAARPTVKVSGSSDDIVIYFPPLNTVAYYKLDGNFINALNTSDKGQTVEVVAQTTPSEFETDENRGQVWHQQEGWSTHDNGYVYTEFSNALLGQDLSNGANISFWAKCPVINWWDSILAFTNGTQRFWFNANGYLGYNDGTGNWFDCQQGNADNALPTDEWTFVSINLTADGFEVYYNGELKFSNESNAAYNSSGMTDFSLVTSTLASVDGFYFGYGSFWSASPVILDDVFLIARSLSETEILALYDDTYKENGVVRNPSYAPSVVAIYNLDGNFSNSLNKSDVGQTVEVVAQTTPSAFETDEIRGQVWHQQEGWSTHDNGYVYTTFSNPLLGQNLSEGACINFWAKCPTINWWDSILAFSDGTQRFWFNANGYLGYNDGTGNWFDCQQGNADNALPTDEWTCVTINLYAEGFDVYYNGELKFSNESNAAYNSSGMTDYSLVTSTLASVDNFYFGYGSFWSASPVILDDVYICAAPMSATKAAAFYNATKK